MKFAEYFTRSKNTSLVKLVLKITKSIERISQSMASPWKVKANDNNLYVLKFANELNNNSIFSELICSQMAKQLDLPTPQWEFLELDQEMIDNVPEFQTRNIKPGIHFGTVFVKDSTNLHPAQFSMPIENIVNQKIIPDLIGFDIFIANSDRSAVNSLMAPIEEKGKKLNYFLIDHGLAFGDGNWRVLTSNAPDNWLHPGTPWNTTNITSGDSFNSIISRLDALKETDFQKYVDEIPSEWNPNQETNSKLVEFLTQRAESGIPTVLDLMKVNNIRFTNWR